MSSDFLSWDDDIDIDILLEEYTDNDRILDSDSDFEDPTPRKKERLEKPASRPTTTKNTRPVYVCPVCHRHYLSIAGFRGHTIKKHQKSGLKASDHLLQPETNQQKDSTRKSVGHIFTEESTFKANFKSAFQETVEKIKADTLFGIAAIVQIASFVQGNLAIEEFFCSLFLGLFSVDINLCLTTDREFFFNKLHRTRIDPDWNQQVFELFVNQGCEDISLINSFVQLFLLEVLEQLLKLQVKFHSNISQQAQTTLSDSDQSILYYISGYVIKALRKRYAKLKDNSCRISCLESLVCRSTQSTFLEKIKKWTKKVDRGGLQIPSDNFYLMIREMEQVVRCNVGSDRLSADSLNCARLRECIMESFMVKYYTKEIFQDISSHSEVMEDIVSLFLRVRGFAVVRVERNKLSSKTLNSTQGKRGHSLRQGLQKNSNLV